MSGDRGGRFLRAGCPISSTLARVWFDKKNKKKKINKETSPPSGRTNVVVRKAAFQQFQAPLAGAAPQVAARARRDRAAAGIGS
jgi:hypothetical protein